MVGSLKGIDIKSLARLGRKREKPQKKVWVLLVVIQDLAQLASPFGKDAVQTLKKQFDQAVPVVCESIFPDCSIQEIRDTGFGEKIIVFSGKRPPCADDRHTEYQQDFADPATIEMFEQKLKKCLQDDRLFYPDNTADSPGKTTITDPDNASLRELFANIRIKAGFAPCNVNSPGICDPDITSAYLDIHLAMGNGDKPQNWNLHDPELRRILDSRLVACVYQPILYLNEHRENHSFTDHPEENQRKNIKGSQSHMRILGWESYARGPRNTMHHSPNRMFASARKSGCTDMLDRICIQAALEKVGFLTKGQKLFINVHEDTFAKDGFSVEYLNRIVSDCGLLPENIVIELSETLLMGNLDEITKRITAFRRNGYEFSIDNFGMGHFPLLSLSRIRPGYIKIHDSLTREIETKPIHGVILEQMLGFSEKIGAKIVAKGIESESEMRYLLSIGITFGQGFFFARPQPVKTHQCRVSDIHFSNRETDHEERKFRSVIPVRSLLMPGVKVTPDTLVEDIKEITREGSPMGSVVIVNGNKPLGILMKYNLDKQLGTRYGVSLFYHRQVARLMDSRPMVVEADTPLEEVAKRAMERSQEKIYDDIIVTENGALAGVVSVQKMLESMVEVAQKERDYAKADNKKIKDSIRYSKMIQSALLPDMKRVKQEIPHSFFIWMPRDIVGGDMYFVEFVEEGLFICIMDCTGHGVPGAFMTMIASAGFRRTIRDDRIRNPKEILNRLNLIVKTTLKQDCPDAMSNDGLDAGICYVETEKMCLTYAGAKIPLLITHGNSDLEIIKPDKQSLGYVESPLDHEFTNHRMHIHREMSFYMYTDGYVDQLGGRDRFPLGNIPFRNFIRRVCHEPFEKQEEMIIENFHNHQGRNDRQDDVTVVGFSLR